MSSPRLGALMGAVGRAVRAGGLAVPRMLAALARLPRWAAGWPGPHAVCPGRAVPPASVLVTAALPPVMVTAAFLAAGALQPSSYSPVQDTVSVMAGQGGTHPWIMTWAMFAAGGCYLLTAAGLAGARPMARVLLAVTGLSSIGIAASPEPVTGPTPQHLAWTALGAVTIMIWPAFTARAAPGQPLILSAPAAAVATVTFAVLLGWVLIEAHGGTLLGLAERLDCSVQACWPFLVAVALRRAGPLPAGPAGSRAVGRADSPPAGPAGSSPGTASPAGSRPPG